MGDQGRYHPRDHLDGLEAFLAAGGYKFRDGSIRRSSGRAVDPAKFYQEWIGAYQGDLPPLTRAQFAELVAELLAEEDPEEFEVPDVEDWIHDQLQELTTPGPDGEDPPLLYDETNGVWTTGVGFPASNAQVEGLVLEKYYQFRDAHPAIRTLWPKDRVQIVLWRVITDYTTRAVRTLRDNLAHDPALEEEGRACLAWVLRDVLRVENPETAVEVVRHWLWQVKRYLTNRPVANPLMVNILGKQGSGKSQFVTMLVGAPGLFGAFTEVASLSVLGDTRDTDAFSTKLVIFFDELAFSTEYGDATRNVEAMKKILTSKYNSRRDLGKNTRSKMRRIFSAIAASNASIVQKIYDPTGMRRYFEVVSTREEKMTPEEHQEVFGEPTQALGTQPETAMDPLLIWRSIDESRDMGYLVGEARQQVEAIQATYQRTDTLGWALREAENEIPHPVAGPEVAEIVAASKSFQRAADFRREYFDAKWPAFVLVRVSVFRKEVVAWLRDQDHNGAKYLPQYDGLVPLLQRDGFAVLHLSDRHYVVCYETYTPEDGDTDGTPY